MKISDRHGLRAPWKSAIIMQLPIVIIAALSFAVYFNSLFNGFVWDDEYTVLQNHLLRDIRHLPSFFTGNVWAFKTEATASGSHYYRPLMNVIFMINYHVFGLQAWGFHLVNVLIHTATSIVAYLIALELFRKEGNRHNMPSDRLQDLLVSVPFITAALFALHPVHAEAVTWVTALTEISYGFFYMLSLLLYIYSSGSASFFKPGYILSVLSFFLAAFCKEPALTLPAILIAYDYALVRKPIFSLASLKRYAPYLLVTGCYLAIRINALGSLFPVKARPNLSTAEELLTVFPLFAEYFRKLLLPSNLNLFDVLHPIQSLATARGLIPLVLAITFMLSLIYSFKRNRIAFFALIFWFITLAPALYIRGIMEASIYVSERYLYLPSFGFLILLSSFLKWAHMNVIKNSAAFAGILLLIAGLYSFGTIQRNTVWKDDYTLFSDTVKRSPYDEIAHINLAGILGERGRIDEAIEHFQTANRLNPENLKTYVWLGDAFYKKGQKDEAIIMYKIALELDPTLLSARKGLGYVYFNTGLIEKASEQYQAALSLAPNDTDILLQLDRLKALQIISDSKGNNRQ